MPARFSQHVVLFDFDGTLADTGPAILRIAAYTLEHHGFSLDSVGDLHQIIGPPLEEGFMAVAGISRPHARELVGTYREAFSREVVPKDYPPFPGMAQLLRALTSQGRSIGVATSRLQTSVLSMLEGIDFPPFDAVAGRIEPERYSKADCIRAALEELEADPAAAVMVGDRHHDVDGAHEVGLPCIGVYRDTASKRELLDAGADAVCAGVDELSALLGV